MSGLPRLLAAIAAATAVSAEIAVPAAIDGLVPFHAGQALAWRFSG